ncbi:transmembrane protein 131-like isoform X2 [Varroa jacobsoni]|uniref:transmembrane protein 131-like isoform X2 n=1 Tax=Varroa jacobsoni TaxID=62625 RepID=UPI000BF8148C|nr:transmembrane protein 131-like isoform X2 [Varroa jacobsoni]
MRDRPVARITSPVLVSRSPLTLPLNVVNTSPKSLSLQGTADSDGLQVNPPEKPVGPGKTCTVKVTIDPQRVSRGNGNLQLKGGKWRLQVPYSLQLLNGSLQAANSKFYIGAKGQRVFSVEVTNTLNTGLRIERILMNSTPLAAPSPLPEVPPSGTLQISLPPVQQQDQLQAASVRSIALPQTNAFGPSTLTSQAHHRYNASLRVLTNVTEFEYKLEFYSNRLDLLVDRRLLVELTEKGTKSLEEIPFDVGTQGIGQKKKIWLELYNPNPVEVSIEHISSNISTSHIALPSLPPWSLGPYRMLQLALTLSSPDEGRTWGLLSVKTNFHSQSWPFVFQTSKGTVTAAAGLSNSATSRSPGVILVEGAFPFRHSSELMYLESSFDAPLIVAGARVDGDDSQFSIELVESPVLHPGAKSLLGTLKYRPSCAGPTLCYVGLGGPLDSSSSKDLYLWRGMQERLKETRALNVSLIVDTLSVKGFVIPITVTHVWPRVTPRGAVRFETTRLGEASEAPVVVDNPSDQPLMMQAYVSTTGGPEVHSIVAAQHAIKLGHLSSAFSLARSVQNSLSLIPPRSKKKIHVRFEPSTIGPHVGVLVVRNNLTAVSSVLLRGEGGMGKLLLAGQEPGETIFFDLNAALLKDCGNIGLYTTLKKYPVAKNVGQLPIRVRRVLINERECVGYGFRVKDCEQFIIKPNASHRIELSFTPDFTVSRVEIVLSLVLDDSILDFNIVATLPKSVVTTCADQVVRPPWEGPLYVTCLIVAILFVACILAYAFLDSNRVLQETLYKLPNVTDQQANGSSRESLSKTTAAASAGTASSALASATAARNGSNTSISRNNTNNVNHVNHPTREDSSRLDPSDPGRNADRSQRTCVTRMFSYGKKMLIDWLSTKAPLGNGHSAAATCGTAGSGLNSGSLLCQYDRKGSLHSEEGGGSNHGDGGGACGPGSNGSSSSSNSTNTNNRRRDSGPQNSRREGTNRRNKKKDCIDSYVRSNSINAGDEVETETATQTTSDGHDADEYSTIVDNDTDKASDRADLDDRDRSNTLVEAETETTSEDSSEASNENVPVAEVTQTIEEVCTESRKLDQRTRLDQKFTRRKERRRKKESNDSPMSNSLTSGGRAHGYCNSHKNDKDNMPGKDHLSNNYSHNNHSQNHHSNGLSATLPDVCVPAANVQRKPPPHTPSPPAEQQLVSNTIAVTTATPPTMLGSSGPGRERRRDSRGGDMHSRHEREIPPRFKKQQVAASFRAALPSLTPQEASRQLTAAVAPVPRTITYSAVVSGGQSPLLTFGSRGGTFGIAGNSGISLAPANGSHPGSHGLVSNGHGATSLHTTSVSTAASGIARRLGGNPPPGFPLRPSLAATFSPGSAGGAMSIGGYAITPGASLNGLHCTRTLRPTASHSPSTSSEPCGNDEQEMAPLIRSIIDSVIPTERDERMSMSWVASNTTPSSPACGSPVSAAGAHSKSGTPTGGSAGNCNTCNSISGESRSSSVNSGCNDDISGTAHSAKNTTTGGKSSGRSLWEDSTWRNSGTNSGSNNSMTSLSSSIPGSPSSPPQCSQTPSALPPTSSNHESTCGFGSGSVAPVAPPSQTFPTFLRRTPERDRERDRREMGLDLHQRHLSQCAEAGAVTQTGQTPAQAWSPTTSVTPRHLYLARGHQIQQRLSHPPTVSPTNDYSYNGANIWGSGTSGLSPTQPQSIFPSPIGTPWTPFRSPSLSLSAVREKENAGKKCQ